jgi:hypothetical protein
LTKPAGGAKTPLHKMDFEVRELFSSVPEASPKCKASDEIPAPARSSGVVNLMFIRRETAAWWKWSKW